MSICVVIGLLGPPLQIYPQDKLGANSKHAYTQFYYLLLFLGAGLRSLGEHSNSQDNIFEETSSYVDSCWCL